MTAEGEEVRARRERLGMHKGELADAAGVNRNTLGAIEAGEGFRHVSLAKIERALDAAEREAGIDEPPPADTAPSGQAGPRMVSFRIGGLVGDVDVVVEGPIDDIDKLRESVERLLQAANGGSRDK